MRISTFPLAAIVVVAVGSLEANAQPIAAIERRLPPQGVDIGDAERSRIRKRLDEVSATFDALLAKKIDSAKHRALIQASRADVEVFLKAVRFALLYDEFYQMGDSAKAYAALETAAARIAALDLGITPLVNARGHVVRGYVSEIDGSPQPYGLEIPEKLDLSKKVPLYVWLHGRSEKVTDLHFLHERSTKGCPISPFVADGIIVHPFGRYCVGYRGPGEIDVLDVIESVKKRYPIDDDRVALLGFSMGGAGAWHIGAHYADRFCVVHAGAGFAETKEFQKIAKEDYPPWYEQTLWSAYDVPDYVRNLFNVPVIAYSGADDKQIQAARVMERAFAAEGRSLKHVVGPATGHKYHPDALKEIMAFVKDAVKRGRDPYPNEVHLQTRTLRYNRMHWVTMTAMERHWTEARIDAEFKDGKRFEFATKGVLGFAFTLPPHWKLGRAATIVVDGTVVADAITATTNNVVALEKTDGRWRVLEPPALVNFDQPIAKRWPGNCYGPVDDVFLKPFLVVEPTGASANPAVQRWVDFELSRFKDRWRALFRGDLRVKKDNALEPNDPFEYNLILWGDPSSNAWIRRFAAGQRPEVLKTDPTRGDFPALPILDAWTDKSIAIRGKTYDSATHVPVMIHPFIARDARGGHPRLRDVVINSGPTFREAHDRSNALQNPKLPDWAILSLQRDPNSESPGLIQDAGFFDESWRLK